MPPVFKCQHRAPTCREVQNRTRKLIDLRRAQSSMGGERRLLDRVRNAIKECRRATQRRHVRPLSQAPESAADGQFSLLEDGVILAERARLYENALSCISASRDPRFDEHETLLRRMHQEVHHIVDHCVSSEIVAAYEERNYNLVAYLTRLDEEMSNGDTTETDDDVREACGDSVYRPQPQKVNDPKNAAPGVLPSRAQDPAGAAPPPPQVRVEDNPKGAEAGPSPGCVQEDSTGPREAAGAASSPQVQKERDPKGAEAGCSSSRMQEDPAEARGPVNATSVSQPQKQNDPKGATASGDGGLNIDLLPEDDYHLVGPPGRFAIDTTSIITVAADRYWKKALIGSLNRNRVPAYKFTYRKGAFLRRRAKPFGTAAQSSMKRLFLEFGFFDRQEVEKHSDIVPALLVRRNRNCTPEYDFDDSEWSTAEKNSVLGLHLEYRMDYNHLSLDQKKQVPRIFIVNTPFRDEHETEIVSVPGLSSNVSKNEIKGANMVRDATSDTQDESTSSSLGEVSKRSHPQQQSKNPASVIDLCRDTPSDSETEEDDAFMEGDTIAGGRGRFPIMSLYEQQMYRNDPSSVDFGDEFPHLAKPNKSVNCNDKDSYTPKVTIPYQTSVGVERGNLNTLLYDPAQKQKRMKWPFHVLWLSGRLLQHMKPFQKRLTANIFSHIEKDVKQEVEATPEAFRPQLPYGQVAFWAEFVKLLVECECESIVYFNSIYHALRAMIKKSVKIIYGQKIPEFHILPVKNPQTLEALREMVSDDRTSRLQVQLRNLVRDPHEDNDRNGEHIRNGEEAGEHLPRSETKMEVICNQPSKADGLPTSRRMFRSRSVRFLRSDIPFPRNTRQVQHIDTLVLEEHSQYFVKRSVHPVGTTSK